LTTLIYQLAPHYPPSPQQDITLSVWVTDQQAPSETSRLQDSTLAE